MAWSTLLRPMYIYIYIYIYIRHVYIYYTAGTFGCHYVEDLELNNISTICIRELHAKMIVHLDLFGKGTEVSPDCFPKPAP